MARNGIEGIGVEGVAIRVEGVPYLWDASPLRSHEEDQVLDMSVHDPVGGRMGCFYPHKDPRCVKEDMDGIRRMLQESLP